MPYATSHNAGASGVNYQVLSSYKTRVLNNNGKTQVFFHKTPVVSFDERSIVLNTGGWRTRTTKVRMNQASQEFGLGFHVFQKDRDWLVDYQDGTHAFNSEFLTLQRDGGSVEGEE